MANEMNVTAGAEQTTATGQTTEVNETKTYTESEVAEMLQRETDRRVTAALKKQQAQFKTELAEAEKQDK